ncbi:MAG: DUF2786 domain-containing protein [Clostridiales bacterium]
MNAAIDKIEKLLALSESPNEAEAKSALLKARELMAKHKISQGDLNHNQSDVIRFNTDVSFSKRREVFIPLLAKVIAERNCCKALCSRIKGKQTTWIVIYGFEDDAKVVDAVIKYSLQFIRHKTQKIIKNTKKNGYGADVTKDLANSYSFGFIEGMSEFYEEQNRNNQNWGLVLTVPQEVCNAIIAFKGRNFVSKMQMNETLFSDGKDDGYNCCKIKQIKKQDNDCNPLM